MNNNGLTEQDLVFHLGSSAHDQHGGTPASEDQSVLPGPVRLPSNPEVGNAETSGLMGGEGNLGDVLKFMENSRRVSQENQNRFLEAILTRLVPGGANLPGASVSLGEFLKT